METYKKTHSSKKALQNHIEKIQERGGEYKTIGLSIEYWFEPMKIRGNINQTGLSISRLDTSFLKKPNNITPKYSMNVVGKGDNEEIVYRTKDASFDKKEAIKIVKLITNIKTPIITKKTDSYSELFYNSKIIGYIKYKDLSILSKYVDTAKLKRINSINDFL